MVTAVPTRDGLGTNAVIRVTLLPVRIPVPRSCTNCVLPAMPPASSSNMSTAALRPELRDLKVIVSVQLSPGARVPMQFAVELKL